LCGASASLRLTRCPKQNYALLISRFAPFTASLLIVSGYVLGRFVGQSRPPIYLLRPLAAAMLLAVLVGLVSRLARKADAVVAAVITILLLYPSSVTLLISLGVAIILLLFRIADRGLPTRSVISVAAAVFFLTGLIRFVPELLEQPDYPQAAIPAGPPVYLVLLDGYPRFDTLADLGFDNSEFVSGLVKRGFDHYPHAQSEFRWTYLTLTKMLTDGYDGPDEWGEDSLRAELRNSWRLPEDYVAVASPADLLIIPGSRILNPGGLTLMEAEFIRDSAFAYFPAAGDFVMNGLRRQLERSVEIVATTAERRVFAHLLAPHTPFLFAENSSPAEIPSCWPDCNITDISPERLQMTMSEYTDGLVGSIERLNIIVLNMVDEILAEHPDALIVLFSDHGARFDDGDLDEWHRPFLAARTPSHPRLFATDPTPGSILQQLDALGS